jgi:hypothetical protein
MRKCATRVGASSGATSGATAIARKSESASFVALGGSPSSVKAWRILRHPDACKDGRG